LGRLHGKLLGDIARWAEATTSCLPFSARGGASRRQVGFILNSGAEQGIAIGDGFSAYKAVRQPVRPPVAAKFSGRRRKRVGEIKGNDGLSALCHRRIDNRLSEDATRSRRRNCMRNNRPKLMAACFSAAMLPD